MSRYGASADNWMDGSQSHRRGDPTRWVPPMLVGGLLFAVGCGSGLFAGYVAGAANSFGSALAGLGGAMLDAEATIDVAVPPQVRAGEPFNVVVTIADTSMSSRLLQDLDLSGIIVDAAVIDAIEPQPLSSDVSEGYREMVFQKPIPAGGVYVITFTMRIDEPGTHVGSVDAYLDDYSMTSAPLIVEVQE